MLKVHEFLSARCFVARPPGSAESAIRLRKTRKPPEKLHGRPGNTNVLVPGGGLSLPPPQAGEGEESPQRAAFPRLAMVNVTDITEARRDSLKSLGRTIGGIFQSCKGKNVGPANEPSEYVNKVARYVSTG
jgi:hypothetical protein